ncbi:hypothetical protein BU17DRAFT_8332, partial [Hysterangium stoloniferum]
MSRLTSKAPFNRPSVFDVLPTRPTPLSPPETERDPGLLQGQEENNASSDIHHAEGSVPRLRRNVPYTSTSILNREPRFPQRQSKWLIMVMPPPSLIHEPPVLGHTLSSAPAGRFSNGILMPLFPTLYNQVMAIAREFNMPSTTGLCIYLQIQENSAMLTPRISDETWQILWAQYFVTDDRATALPSHGLPIAGRIEFDIDLRRAKWFNNWTGNQTRDRVDADCVTLESSVVPTHWRGDSRYSILPTEQPSDESPSPPSVNEPSFRVQRQLPRPLFLEKRDTPIKSISRHPSRVPSISQNVSEHKLPVQRTSNLPAEPTVVPTAVSPVVQSSEEPAIVKKAELDTLVLQWRASSVAGGVSTAIAAGGQPSLDPVNMPPGPDVELDLDDFAWSISSAGPPSERPMSPHWPEPLPSIHLVDRLQGSVCLTPTTCTSWGPLDTPDYSIVDISRQPSPDLGLRMMEFVPLTPSTATSWGPEDLPSPSLSAYDYAYRPPSIDIGQRATGSVPVTPSTATSWGPADPPLFPPETPHYTRTPDVGERGFADLQDQPALPPVLPCHDAESAKPWRYVWPYLSEHDRKSVHALLPEATPWRYVWPYLSEHDRKSVHALLPEATPWRYVWPYLSEHDRKSVHALLPEATPWRYYPDFTSLYPSDRTQPRAAANKVKSVNLNEARYYPHLEIYPAVYPHNLIHIYRPVLIPTDMLIGGPKESTNESANAKSVILPSRYPVLDIYPAVYPHNLVRIYPLQYSSLRKNKPIATPDMHTVSVKNVYPYFDLYTAVYPHNLDHIYPTQNQDAFKVDDTLVYPAQRTQLLAWYPLIEPYPQVYPYNLERIYPTLSMPNIEDTKLSGASKTDDIGVYLSQPAQLLASYPLIEPYPPVYPFNLERIYRTLSMPKVKHTRLSPSHKSRIVELHSPGYPHDLDNIYPPNKHTVTTTTFEGESRPIVLLTFKYPAFNIYPSVYPYNMEQIYPDDILSTNLTVNHGYPVIEIYPNVYPYNLEEIYSSLNQKTRTQGTYPFIEIYESVYPHLVIYPPVVLSENLGSQCPRCDGISVTLTTTYPSIHLYEPVYPYLVIYP